MEKKRLASKSTEAIALAFKQNRTSEIWGEIYRRYYERVVRFCMKMGLKRDDALDMAQDTMLKIYGQIFTLKKPSSFESWLFRMAHNACINHLKHQSKHPIEPVESLTFIEPVVTSENLLDEELTIQRRHQQMTAVIDSMPPETKRLLQMKYLENYSVKALEKIFDLNESAVKMRLLRAKQRVRLAYLRRPSIAV